MNNLPHIKKPGLAIDIDETLSWTIGYWVAKMQEKFGNPENLTIKEIIEKYRYTQNVPYWQSDEAKQWIQDKIHSDDLQKELPLIEGANAYLNKINEIIPIAAYITVRPEKVINGTQDWLDKHGFPKAPIICKPMEVSHQNGNQWKAEVLQKLYPDILGMIDDNAKLLEYLAEDYKGIIFLYDHTNIDSKFNVIACKNWLNVYVEMKKYFKK
ncbi:MAG: hypothetical protein PHI73_00760 [Patescibacteria group bacterium]|nr:hypothetical protein [Patescibacteria group bacterium]